MSKHIKAKWTAEELTASLDHICEAGGSHGCCVANRFRMLDALEELTAYRKQARGERFRVKLAEHMPTCPQCSNGDCIGCDEGQRLEQGCIDGGVDPYV